MTIRVLVADDQAMARTGVRLILAGEPDIEVVAEAADGIEAVAEARHTSPDVASLDVRMPRMPRMDGLEALKQISGFVNIVVVTTFDHDEYVHTALHNGACGRLSGCFASSVRLRPKVGDGPANSTLAPRAPRTSLSRHGPQSLSGQHESVASAGWNVRC